MAAGQPALQGRPGRVRALGWWSFVTAGSPVLGVVLGGPLVEAVGWRAILLIQAPLCIGSALAVAAVLMPETEGGDAGTSTGSTTGGAVLLGAGVTSLLLATNRGGVWGWSSPAVLALYAVRPAGARCVRGGRRRPREPLLPLAWLGGRNKMARMANQFLANFAYMGGFILTPVLLQEGLGYTAAASGLLIISVPFTFAITAAGGRIHGQGGRTGRRSGWRRDRGRFDDRAGHDTEGSSWVVGIAVALALSGMGLGVSAPAMTATVVNAVDDSDLGVAGAMQQLVVQVGAVIGLQVMQTPAGELRARSGRRRPVPGGVPGRSGRVRAGGGGGGGSRGGGCGPAPTTSGRDGLDLLGDLLRGLVATGPPCMAMSFVMSPCTLILPAMNPCIAAA